MDNFGVMFVLTDTLFRIDIRECDNEAITSLINLCVISRL